MIFGPRFPIRTFLIQVTEISWVCQYELNVMGCLFLRYVEDGKFVKRKGASWAAVSMWSIVQVLLSVCTIHVCVRQVMCIYTVTKFKLYFIYRIAKIQTTSIMLLWGNSGPRGHQDRGTTHKVNVCTQVLGSRSLTFCILTCLKENVSADLCKVSFSWAKHEHCCQMSTQYTKCKDVPCNKLLKRCFHRPSFLATVWRGRGHRMCYFSTPNITVIHNVQTQPHTTYLCGVCWLRYLRERSVGHCYWNKISL